MTTPLKEATQQYLQYLEAKGKSPRTLITYGVDLKILTQFFGEAQPLGKITAMQVGKFLKSPHLLQNSKTGAPRSEITLNKNIRVVRQFFLWAKGSGLIAQVPLPKSVPLGRVKTTNVEA